MRINVRALGVAATMPVAAMAQPFPGSAVEPGAFYAQGYAQVEYIDSEDGFLDSEFLFGSVASVGFAPRDDAAFSLGFDLTFDGYIVDDGSVSAEFASILFSTPLGLVSAGAPRDALDDYIDKPLFGQSVAADASLILADRSTTTLVAFLLDETPLGVRYDGGTGELSYGFSVHEFDEVDATTASAAVRYQVGDLALSLGVDYLDDEFGTETGLHASAFLDYGTVGGTILYDRAALADQEFVQISGFYRPFDRAKLEVGYLDIEDAADGWAVNGLYDVTEDIYVNLGYVDIADTGTFGLGLGLRF